MTLQFIECPLPYTNKGAGWIYIYSQTPITVYTDAGGRTVKMGNTPCWLPPGFTIDTGVAGNILLGLQSTRNDPLDFAGFLSSASGGSVGAPTEATINVGYTKAYTGVAMSGAPGAGNGSVDNNGYAILGMTTGGFDLVTPAGVMTYYSANLGGDFPNAQGQMSIGGTHRVYVDDTANGFLYFKNGAFFGAYVTSLAGAPTHVAMSPSGKYVFLYYSAGSTMELWVGS